MEGSEGEHLVYEVRVRGGEAEGHLENVGVLPGRHEEAVPGEGDVVQEGEMVCREEGGIRP